jgi:hypothetical protein
MRLVPLIMKWAGGVCKVSNVSNIGLCECVCHLHVGYLYWFYKCEISLRYSSIWLSFLFLQYIHSICYGPICVSHV